MTAEVLEMDPDSIVWEDPPVGSRGRPRVQPLPAEVVAELRAHPGRWGRVGTFEAQTAASRERARVLSSLAKYHPEDTWDAVTRKVGDRSWGLWVKWVGRADAGQLSLDDVPDEVNDAVDGESSPFGRRYRTHLP